MGEGDFFVNVEQSSFEEKLAKWVDGYYHAVQQLDFGNEA
jgi:hypothetical protein